MRKIVSVGGARPGSDVLEDAEALIDELKNHRKSVEGCAGELAMSGWGLMWRIALAPEMRVF
jgi:hypothetical protein